MINDCVIASMASNAADQRTRVHNHTRSVWLQASEGCEPKSLKNKSVCCSLLPKKTQERRRHGTMTPVISNQPDCLKHQEGFHAFSSNEGEQNDNNPRG